MIATDMTAEKLADEAIGLFLEYRDVHGYDEDQARLMAASEVQQGVDAEVELRAAGEIAPEGTGINWPRPEGDPNEPVPVPAIGELSAEAMERRNAERRAARDA